MSDAIKKEIMEWLKAFVFALIVMGIFNFFFTTTMVYSTSMYPTLIEKDLLLLKRGTVVQRGDIVSFKSELLLSEGDIKRLNPIQRIFVNTKTHKNLIKRVIGLPGDSIRVTDEKVYVNGNLLDEAYVSSPTTGEVDIEKIPEGQYFMMGDNRSVSLDSRSMEVGTIEQDRIIGKVLVRVFPFNKIGTVK